MGEGRRSGSSYFGVWHVAGGGFREESVAQGPWVRREGRCTSAGEGLEHKDMSRGSFGAKTLVQQERWGAALELEKASPGSEAWADLGGDGNLT